MSLRDYNSYRKMYEAILQALRPPDLLIYIRASVPTLQAHIRKRGRAYEASISESYLARRERPGLFIGPRVVVFHSFFFVSF